MNDLYSCVAFHPPYDFVEAYADEFYEPTPSWLCRWVGGECNKQALRRPASHVGRDGASSERTLWWELQDE